MSSNREKMFRYFSAKSVAIPYAEEIMAARTPKDCWRIHQKIWRRLVVKQKHCPPDALTLTKEAIGWCFAAGMTQEQVDMWVKKTQATHPIFGQRIPTEEEALAEGIAMGRDVVREEMDGRKETP